jgi:ribosome-associated protein
MLVIDERIRIPSRELRFQFARSTGPGGQNVNKVSSKARLRWAVTRSPSLPPDVRERFLKRYRRRITRDDEFVLTSQRYRDQSRNVEDCLEKLRVMLAAVAVAPTPRRPTRPGKRARERRLQEKRTRADVKRHRRRVTAKDLD